MERSRFAGLRNGVSTADAHRLYRAAGCGRPRAAATQGRGDYTVRFGIVSTARAPMAVAPYAATERGAHGLHRPDAAGAHHLMLVDVRDRDRQRMQAVQARASVEPSDRMETRVLEPMRVNGGMMYGGAFFPPVGALLRGRRRVFRPGASQAWSVAHPGLVLFRRACQRARQRSASWRCDRWSACRLASRAPP